MEVKPRALFSALEADLASDCSLTPGFDFLETEAFGDSTRALAASRLKRSLLKKLKDTEQPDAEKKAFDLWSHYNKRCSEFRFSPQLSYEEELIGEFKHSCDRFFNYVADRLTWEAVLTEARTGPGKTLLAKSTDMYSKLYSSPLSCTSQGLHRLYKADTMSNHTRFIAEETRASLYGSTVVPGSRLAFVPKTHDIRRSICVEPNLNIYLQLGLGTILTSCIRERFGISLVDQAEKNRVLAKQGSLDGSFATIDLSSASDSISLRLLEEVIPPRMLGWLYQLRSPLTQYQGTWIELHMVSSMGNGFTFPLQTALFSCMVDAVYRYMGIHMRRPFRDAGNFGVFGDDIICLTVGSDPTRAYRLLTRLLELCGFVVNQDKSFCNGLFRESCGREYYMGRNVRGVYLKTLRTVPGRFVAINRLLEWSAEHGVELPRTVRLLRDSVPRMLVPPDEAMDGGIRVPWSLVRTRLPRDRNGSPVYQYLAPRADFLEFDSNERPRTLARKLGLSINPYGLWLTFLAGHLRNGKIGVRPVHNRYHRRSKVTPSWDNFRVNEGLSDPHGRQQWESTVESSLTG